LLQNRRAERLARSAQAEPAEGSATTAQMPL